MVIIDKCQKTWIPLFYATCPSVTQIDDPQSYPTLKFLFGTQSLCQLLIYLKFNANPAGYTSFFLLFKKNFHTRSHQDTLIYHSMKARCLAMTSQLHVKTIQQILWYMTTVKMLKIIDTVINKSEKHSWDIIFIHLAKLPLLFLKFSNQITLNFFIWCSVT